MANRENQLTGMTRQDIFRNETVGVDKSQIRVGLSCPACYRYHTFKATYCPIRLKL